MITRPRSDESPVSIASCDAYISASTSSCARSFRADRPLCDRTSTP